MNKQKNIIEKHLEIITYSQFCLWCSSINWHKLVYVVPSEPHTGFSVSVQLRSSSQLMSNRSRLIGKHRYPLTKRKIKFFFQQNVKYRNHVSNVKSFKLSISCELKRYTLKIIQHISKGMINTILLIVFCLFTINKLNM